MEFNLWTFLAMASLPTMGMIITALMVGHQQKMKQLELEALKVKEANMDEKVDEAVEKKFRALKDRIEVLEAVVTDRGFDLSDKITRLN